MEENKTRKKAENTSQFFQVCSEELCGLSNVSKVLSTWRITE